MHNPWIAIGAAGLAGWLFGAAWYTGLGKVWQAALGLNPEGCKPGKSSLVPVLVALLAALAMSAVLYQLIVNLGVLGIAHAAIAGLTVGIGFLFTSTLVNNLFQGRKLLVTAIDGAHWVLAVTIEGAVIGALL